MLQTHSRITLNSHPSEFICNHLLNHNLLNNIHLAFMNFGSAAFNAKLCWTLTREDQVRPLFAMGAFGDRHGALSYLADILFVS